MKSNFIEDFINEGLVSERMVTDETPSDVLPKVNDDLPQTIPHDMSSMDKKEPEDAKTSDEYDNRDMMMRSVIKSMESVCASLDNICSQSNYTEEMMAKLRGMKERCREMGEILKSMHSGEKSLEMPVKQNDYPSMPVDDTAQQSSVLT